MGVPMVLARDPRHLHGLLGDPPFKVENLVVN
jgi:hypothetical protein